MADIGQERLRILMVMHMPWNRDLGGPRVQIELGEEFVKFGHHVEKFSFEDAFPKEGGWARLAARYFPPDFAARAVAFVRRQAGRFDVIDANQGNLPCTKRQLGFEGLLVARSVGLHEFYERFAKFADEKWPAKRSAKAALLGALGRRAAARAARHATRSLETADLINVPNRDELRFLADRLGLDGKCCVFPYGLAGARWQEFRYACRMGSDERRFRHTVAFVGAWCPRKGSKDWGAIIRRVRQRAPNARFLFLGTGFGARAVLRDLNQEACDWIRVVPRFTSAELPELLAEATVGAFPSYIEGFPFGVLEMLAAGLPTVSYDVPGPRAMLNVSHLNLLVKAGDANGLGDRVGSLLELPAEEYGALAEECVSIAGAFNWSKIAADTLAVYRRALRRLPGSHATGLSGRVASDASSVPTPGDRPA